MANQRTADLLIGAFKDEMSTRRKYELEAPDGTKIELYFPPITRFDRQMVHLHLICQMHQYYKDHYQKKFLMI